MKVVNNGFWEYIKLVDVPVSLATRIDIIGVVSSKMMKKKSINEYIVTKRSVMTFFC